MRVIAQCYSLQYTMSGTTYTNWCGYKKLVWKVVTLIVASSLLTGCVPFGVLQGTYFNLALILGLERRALCSIHPSSRSRTSRFWKSRYQYINGAFC